MIDRMSQIFISAERFSTFDFWQIFVDGNERRTTSDSEPCGTFA